jgi:hypothetical protein
MSLKEHWTPPCPPALTPAPSTPLHPNPPPQTGSTACCWATRASPTCLWTPRRSAPTRCSSAARTLRRSTRAQRRRSRRSRARPRPRPRRRPPEPPAATAGAGGGGPARAPARRPGPAPPGGRRRLVPAPTLPGSSCELPRGARPWNPCHTTPRTPALLTLHTAGLKTPSTWDAPRASPLLPATSITAHFPAARPRGLGYSGAGAACCAPSARQPRRARARRAAGPRPARPRAARHLSQPRAHAQSQRAPALAPLPAGEPYRPTGPRRGAAL